MPQLRIFGRSRKKNEVGAPVRPRVMFVSHEATRTGAPKIILKIVKRAFETCDIDCETVLHEEGHLSEEFNQYSQVHCLGLPRLRSVELQKKVRSVVKRRGSQIPAVAICNSMESRFVSEQLGELGVPVISLLHELPCSYSDADYEMVYANSEKVVFPVQMVRETTHKKMPIPFGKDLVMPQGLLDPGFGKSITREAARKRLRHELSIPHDAFIVLGCGTLDMRKGLDHFAAIAKSVVRKNVTPDSIHFVWVGDGPKWPHSTYHYVQIDLRHSGVAANVHFVGEKEHVDTYFMGSDLFLLSSRVDPFPCVVHEAMATRLPVMTFDNSGGAVEALAGGAGLVVPYADYEVATHLILAHHQNPGLADGIRETGFRRVQEDYCFERYADKILGLAANISGVDFSRSNSAARPLGVSRAA